MLKLPDDAGFKIDVMQQAAAAGDVQSTDNLLGLRTVLLHAAVMDDRISRVAVEQSLLSYHLVGASPIHRDLEDTIIPGVLGRYDLPDLAAALAPRPVSILYSVSPTGRVLLRKDV